MSAYKILHDEAQASELNTHTGQGSEGVSGKVSHVAGEEHNAKVPSGAPNDWSQAETTSWLSQLSSRSGTPPAA